MAHEVTGHSEIGVVRSFDEFLASLREDPLLDLLRDGLVVIDAEKRVRFINRHAQELLRIDESEAGGKICYEVVRSEVCNGTCDRCLHQEGERFMENFNVDVVTQAGEIVACCMHTSVIQDPGGKVLGYVEHFREMGQVRDIIEQQSELLKLYSLEKERVQTLINSIGDGVFTLGLDGRFRSISPRLEEMTGLLERDLLGKPLKEILSDPVELNVPGPEELARRVMNGNEIHDQRTAVLTARGEAIPVLLNTLPLKDPANERMGLMGIVRDLNELEGLKRALEDRYSFANIIGTGPRMQEIFELIERVSDTGTNVLIQGESGTGKELVARAFHYHSPRKDHPFIKINCAALPDPLLESELFGYEKGAFTGAHKRKPGKFKLADGGTIFLDEIGETSPAFQAKLLRVVQDLEFEPLGGTAVERVDVRILAATNKDLRKEIASGRFREDLYYRLCVLPIALPPLRDRKEDIPLLIDHFLDKVARKYPARRIEKPVFMPWAVSVLMDHAWPGNIRELENAVERAYVCSTTGRIDVSSLPPEIREKMGGEPLNKTEPSPPPPDPQLQGQGPREGADDLIQKVLTECAGNKTLAAKKLGIGRTTLWRRLQEMEAPEKNPS